MLRARDIVNWSLDDLLAKLPNHPFGLQFDDKTVETVKQDVVISWFIWEFVRKYPKTPLTSAFLLGRKRMGKKSTLVLLGILKETFKAYNGEIHREELWKIAQEITNELYNKLTSLLGSYVATVSIRDAIAIRRDPEAAKILADARPTQHSVEETYEKLGELLNTPNRFPNNQIIEPALAGLVPMGQVLQNIGIRGMCTDADQAVFRKGITSSFVGGLNELADSLMESRSATKSLMLQKDAISDSEYFSRQLQLVGFYVRSLHFRDCGSNKYLNFTVKAKDLPNIEGSYYLTNDGLKAVERNDKHLVGQTIQLRSGIHCRDVDRYGICSTCFGELAFSIPDDTYIGWVSVLVLAEQVTQKLLSNKHLDMSASVDDIELTDIESHFLRSEAGKVNLWLARRLKNFKVTLRLSESECQGLGDILHTDDLNSLSPQNITQINDIKLFIKSKQGTEEVMTLNAAIGKRLASLTKESLNYLKHNGWELTSDRHYDIDLSNWNIEDPLLELPLRHINMVDYAEDLTSMIIGAGKERGASVKQAEGIKAIRDHKTPDEALLALYSLVNSRCDVNIAHLAVIIRALSCADPANRDYRLPAQDQPAQFAPFAETMAKRSFAGMLAWQTSRDWFFNPETYLIEYRPPHPIDDLFIGR